MLTCGHHDRALPAARPGTESIPAIEAAQSVAFPGQTSQTDALNNSSLASPRSLSLESGIWRPHSPVLPSPRTLHFLCTQPAFLLLALGSEPLRKVLLSACLGSNYLRRIPFLYWRNFSLRTVTGAMIPTQRRSALTRPLQPFLAQHPPSPTPAWPAGDDGKAWLNAWLKIGPYVH